MIEVGSFHTHKKRGGNYQVIGTAEMQTGAPVAEGEKLVIYQCQKTGRLWARPEAEFNDGRFEARAALAEPLDHAEIFLAPTCAGCWNAKEDRLWCQDNVWDACEECGREATRYVLAKNAA